MLLAVKISENGRPVKENRWENSSMPELKFNENGAAARKAKKKKNKLEYMKIFFTQNIVGIY